jgi:hypothetical protein
MKQHLGLRVLITLGDNDAPQMTCVRAISPNGKYALLDDYAARGQVFGWQPISGFQVVDVLGPQEETEASLHKRLLARVLDTISA